MPDTPAPTPLTLGDVSTDFTYYGVRIAMLGEDGDACLAFTHDARRAIAATRRHIREEYSELVTRLDTHGPKWIQVFDTCGCPDDTDPGANCAHYGLPPCHDEYGWMAEPCTPTDLNALAAIEFEWDC